MHKIVVALLAVATALSLTTAPVSAHRIITGRLGPGRRPRPVRSRCCGRGDRLPGMLPLSAGLRRLWQLRRPPEYQHLPRSAAVMLPIAPASAGVFSWLSIRHIHALRMRTAAREDEAAVVGALVDVNAYGWKAKQAISAVNPDN